MAAVESVSNQSAVGRVTSLPLVSSTYGLVCSVYWSTREHNPYLRSMCHAAEQGVRVITSVAMTTALPIMDRLEPQLAIANDLACKGLDQIEKTLPILHQPSDQIVANARGAVSSATGAVTVARATVSGRLSGVVDRTRVAVSGGVDKALSTSEHLMEQYLPLGPEETDEEEEGGLSMGPGEPSYYVRLGSLSTRLRRRTYGRALARVREARQRSQEAIAQLHHSVDLVEYARRNIHGANRRVYDTLSSLVERRSSSSSSSRGQEANNAPRTEQQEAVETHTMARSLTQQLQTTCSTLASGLQDLPRHLQREVLSLGRTASHAYAGLARAAGAELPAGALAGGRARLGHMKRSLDHVLDYLVNNTPLNWLVGPFYPRLAPAAAPPPSQTTRASGPPAQCPSRREPSPPAWSPPEPCAFRPVGHQEEVCEAEMLRMDIQQIASQ